MDFFSAQDNARKNTKWLVLLFVVAVLAMIGLLYLAVVVVVSYSDTARMAEPIQWWQPRVLLIVAGATSAVILLGSLYKTAVLARGGGAAVAESLGGRLVSRDTHERLERRLLNVVDEMAIASGVPVPKVYLLDDEPSINAFAAGVDVQHAVVAVTRGCLEQLSRDELQGVVAHEFSHILNGDMRMNLRLIGILHGILLLALAGRTVLRGSGRGRYRYRSRGSGKGAGGVYLIALALLLVGYVGLFFGRVLKAAVSRQREFLADAAAVQFTRNPDGLAGALKKIGGFVEQTIEHPNAEEASHMFFDTGVVMHLNLLATHPPLETRIQRIEPMFRGERTQAAAAAPGAEGAMGLAGEAGVAVSPEAVRGSVGNNDARHLRYAREIYAGIAPALMEDVRHPLYARAVLYAVLAAPLDEADEALSRVLGREPAEVLTRARGHLAACRALERAAQLPLIELCVPAIAERDGEAAEALLAQARALVEYDRRVSVFEYAVLSLLDNALGERLRARGAGHDLGRLREDCRLVLSLLAHAGHSKDALAERAFAEAAGRLGLDRIGGLLPRREIALPRFSEALARLDGVKYRFKAGLIEACVAAVSADGKVTVTEAELLRAIGARLDCPIPPILPGAVAAG